MWVESEPVFSGRQRYMVIDAAVGIVERGSGAVKDAVAEQPWLPDGPIATEVTYRMKGYERVSHGAPVPAPVKAVPAPERAVVS